MREQVRRRLLALLCIVIFIRPISILAATAEPPMGSEFSAYEHAAARMLAADTPVENAFNLTIKTADGLSADALARLQTMLTGLTARVTDCQDLRLFAFERAGAPILTIWEQRGESDLTFGTNLIPSESILMPLGGLLNATQTPQGEALDYQSFQPPDAAEEWRQVRVGLANLGVLPGVGDILANPAARFWSETRDERPVWDAVERLWQELLIRMSPYGSEGNAPLVDGADPVGHCTTYTLGQDELAALLSDWARSLSGEPQLLWLYNFLGMDEAGAAAYAGWFDGLADSFAGLTMSGTLKLRVYLNYDDEVTAITGSVTIGLGKVTLPLSVSYRKKTSGNTANRTLTVKALPSGGEDGFRLTMKNSVTVNPRGQNKRSLNVTLDGRLLGESFKLSMASAETNEWAVDSDSSRRGTEKFISSGTLTLETRARERLKVTWSGTGSARFDKDIPENNSLERVTSFKMKWSEASPGSLLADYLRAWLEDTLGSALMGGEFGGLLVGDIEGELAVRARPVNAINVTPGDPTVNLGMADSVELAELVARLSSSWDEVAVALGISAK
ncbi:hypothetical protein AGMMS49992_07170 [Clostridia bacterium]|nr:hypothetical protein AGMMS49992_07170 [Clostridia bacterium]